MRVSGSTNDQFMCTAAHRYCLGRQSYIVGACHEWLRATWEQFEPNTQNVMVRDTIEALMNDRAGAACDIEGWWAFINWAWPRLTPEQQEWVRAATSRTDKPWPLPAGRQGL